ncbi:Helix-turn-helix domain-containing protein [Rhodoblastus acidophilus]|uniref:Helix-turn-helix domain-containing protein n=1 Tax=Rhodoblastus acidophilus TaxID=1074 RepID=A0A212RB61_RHOAC|nr:helix-turn-helix transcriptional regulator [Rhodoblastus acidophilus]PPQ39353.1 XRE family transcriptional regulator [Rhodoblastus acidophilus]RAI22425.1 XRE family transcriptional regulator [Rhodoblastus acidophilus]SNB69305.1 Helix-turn-helix domain-containing protein [Rhodoblastus acidophilus]
MAFENFDARRRAVRMTVKELAKRSGLDEDNVHRVLKGRNDARQSTIEAIEQALAEEERNMAAYLGGLRSVMEGGA